MNTCKKKKKKKKILAHTGWIKKWTMIFMLFYDYTLLHFDHYGQKKKVVPCISICLPKMGQFGVYPKITKKFFFLLGLPM